MSIANEFAKYYSSTFGQKVLDLETEYIEKHLGDCHDILDVGCGIGVFEEKLHHLPITGLDISPTMLEEAKRRSNKRFILGDATKIEFPGASFDGAFSVTTLEFIPNIQGAVREIHRILEPEGKVVFLILNTRSHYFRQWSQQEDSYFKKICHTPQIVKQQVYKLFDVTSEYILGIDNLRIFHTQDPKWAALLALKGKKR